MPSKPLTNLVKYAINLLYWNKMLPDGTFILTVACITESTQCIAFAKWLSKVGCVQSSFRVLSGVASPLIQDGRLAKPKESPPLLEE